MLRRVAVTAAILVGLTACAAPAPARPTFTPNADGTPATGTVMVCTPEISDQATVYLGITPTTITTPTWRDRIYSCTYIYPDGQIILSIKELSSPEETTDYVAAVVARLGQGAPANLGDAAFTTTDGSMVMRKDNKVLVVDTSNLPNPFGDPPVDRATAANLVTAVVAACWTGA